MSSTFFIFSKLFFNQILKKIKRRKRDLNPRAAINDLLPFQGSPFSLLGTSPNSWISYYLKLPLRDNSRPERVGFEPTRPCGQTVFKTASLWPLRYLSIRLPLGQRKDYSSKRISKCQHLFSLFLIFFKLLLFYDIFVLYTVFSAGSIPSNSFRTRSYPPVSSVWYCDNYLPPALLFGKSSALRPWHHP